jgi:purine-binding chemotaxis protein CheW
MQTNAAGTDDPVLTLGIDREVFAVPVQAVREILALGPICRLPDAPAHLAGLIDVRGQAVPVIDLRIRLGLPSIPPTESTRVVVLDIALAGRELAIGLIADRVFEVAQIDPATMQPPPDIGTAWQAGHIRAIGRHGKDFVILLDLPELFSTSDATVLRQQTELALANATDSSG